jgi:glycosyltransferase involved in cell wall biosynthesis
VHALLDARLGRRITGIGFYTVNLAQQFGEIAPAEVTPVVVKRHRRRFAAMGLTPYVAPMGADGDARLPAADVIHGPNFHAPNHPSAQRVATIQDLGYLHLPECHPRGMPERLDALIREAIPRTSLFFCISESTRNDFMEVYGVPESRCRVSYLGVDADAFASRPGAVAKLPPWWRIRGRYLLHVGAMVPRKDLRTLVEAFSLVRRSHPDVLLVLAGNKTKRWASDWPRVREWMKANPADAKHVRVLNYVPERFKSALYQNAAACVSATRWEGFGLTVLEGLAAGKPVISSRISSIPEVGGDLVYYGEPRRPETYADAIRRALDETPSAEVAAERYRRAATFTWRRTAEVTLEGYRAACGPLAIDAAVA